MLLNNYDGASGEYRDSDSARESPREPGKPLIPAFATPQSVPPVPPGFAAVFLGSDGIPPPDYRGGTWQLVIDQRGQYYRTIDGQPEYLSELGIDAVTRGLTVLEPPQNSKWNGKKWIADKEKIKAFQNAEIRSQIARIEQEEQPAAQRKFALDGDTSLMRAVQDKIDILAAQLLD